MKKKKYDPLWEIVGEQVSLQGTPGTVTVVCPECQVAIDLSGGVQAGARFRCGLCGALCEAVTGSLIADDGAPEVVARLAK